MRERDHVGEQVAVEVIEFERRQLTGMERGYGHIATLGDPTELAAVAYPVGTPLQPECL